jgi:hypothetical protein
MMNKSTDTTVSLARTRSQSRLVLSAVFLIAAGVGLLGQLDTHKSAYAQAISPHPISNVLIQPTDNGVDMNCPARPV